MSSSVVDLSNLGDGYPSSYWPNYHDPDPGVATVDIPLESDVGKAVIGYFASTLGSGTTSYSWPVRIVANTNKKLYKHFSFQNKCFVEDDGAANAVWGWHGTGYSGSKSANESKITAILTRNFFRDFNQTSLWGKGTYFSARTDYSFHGYSHSYDISGSSLPGFKTKRPLQEKSIILTMLLLGKRERIGQNSHGIPDMHIGYDSRHVPNDRLGNEFYILGPGTDKQAFPAFVVYFEHYKYYDISAPPW
jgi:hypothetical protein